MVNSTAEKFDVIVIGGGPAGLMAAGSAAEAGAHVLLLEKNNAAGRKLLMTGNGRCNLTQAEFDIRSLAKLYHNGAFLLSAFARFGPVQVMDFFESAGVRLKTEAKQRVFPVTDKAEDVLEALSSHLKKHEVKIIKGCSVSGLTIREGAVASVKCGDGEYEADKFIICTGGKSYPSTGSTGDGWRWLESAGHKIVAPRPALVPLTAEVSWVKELSPTALGDVSMAVEQDGKILATARGGMIFTHFGISGPAVLAVSREAVLAMEKGRTTIAIDFMPDLSAANLENRLNEELRRNPGKGIKRALALDIPDKLLSYILHSVGIDQAKSGGQITKQERGRLVGALKRLEVPINGSLGYASAMLTSGGVDIKEVDPKTMQSKILNNLYLAGEVLDVDGPTGGYNLQVCWSTGRIAGLSAALA